LAVLWRCFGSAPDTTSRVERNLTQIVDIPLPERRAHFMSDRKRSKTEERSFARMLDDLEEQEIAFERFKRIRSLAPPGWHSVERRAGIRPRKTKLTVTLDADMVA